MSNTQELIISGPSGATGLQLVIDYFTSYDFPPVNAKLLPNGNLWFVFDIGLVTQINTLAAGDPSTDLYFTSFIWQAVRPAKKTTAMATPAPAATTAVIATTTSGGVKDAAATPLPSLPPPPAAAVATAAVPVATTKATAAAAGVSFPATVTQPSRVFVASSIGAVQWLCTVMAPIVPPLQSVILSPMITPGTGAVTNQISVHMNMQHGNSDVNAAIVSLTQLNAAVKVVPWTPARIDTFKKAFMKQYEAKLATWAADRCYVHFDEQQVEVYSITDVPHIVTEIRDSEEIYLPDVLIHRDDLITCVGLAKHLHETNKGVHIGVITKSANHDGLIKVSFRGARAHQTALDQVRLLFVRYERCTDRITLTRHDEKYLKLQKVDDIKSMCDSHRVTAVYLSDLIKKAKKNGDDIAAVATHARNPSIGGGRGHHKQYSDIPAAAAAAAIMEDDDEEDGDTGGRGRGNNGARGRGANGARGRGRGYRGGGNDDGGRGGRGGGGRGRGAHPRFKKDDTKHSYVSADYDNTSPLLILTGAPSGVSAVRALIQRILSSFTPVVTVTLSTARGTASIYQRRLRQLIGTIHNDYDVAALLSVQRAPGSAATGPNTPRGGRGGRARGARGGNRGGRGAGGRGNGRGRGRKEGEEYDGPARESDNNDRDGHGDAAAAVADGDDDDDEKAGKKENITACLVSLCGPNDGDKRTVATTLSALRIEKQEYKLAAGVFKAMSALLPNHTALKNWGIEWDVTVKLLMKSNTLVIIGERDEIDQAYIALTEKTKPKPEDEMTVDRITLDDASLPRWNGVTTKHLLTLMSRSATLRTDAINECKKHRGVYLDFKKDATALWTLKGGKAAVARARAALILLRDRVVAAIQGRQVMLNAGLRSLLNSKAHELERRHDVSIRYASGESSNVVHAEYKWVPALSVGTTTTTTTGRPTTPAVGAAAGGVRTILLQACLGDIVKERVDVVVNAANQQLGHGGGIAAAIAKAAGAVFTNDSDDSFRQLGRLVTGDARLAPAGDLAPNISYIVNAVGPALAPGATGATLMERSQLVNAVRRSLQLADTKNATSIAIPAISSGLFNYPLQQCTETIMWAVTNYLQTVPTSRITNVRLISNDATTCHALAAAVNHFSNVTSASNKGTATAATLTTLGALPSSTDNNEYKDVIVAQFQWYWRMDDGKTWQPYDHDQYLQIEKFHLSSAPQTDVLMGDIDGSKNGNQYIVVFDPPMVGGRTSAGVGVLQIAGRQLNAKTKHPREVARSLMAAPLIRKELIGRLPSSSPSRSPSSAAETKKGPTAARLALPSSQSADASITVLIFGLTIAQAQAGADAIAALRNSNMIQTNIVLPSLLTQPELQVLCELVTPHFVQLGYEPTGLAASSSTSSLARSSPATPRSAAAVAVTPGAPVLIASGANTCVPSAVVEIQQWLLARASSSSVIPKYPSHWSARAPDDKQLRLVSLVRSSTLGSEWVGIEQKVRVTMPSATIHFIQRVENTWLWDSYVPQRDRMLVKNGAADLNEMDLFHGCRGTDPALIYNGEYGFDMRWSSVGMWGQGLYFATKASYSNDYASHVQHDGTQVKQFFLCHVIVGRAHECPANNTIKFPPQLPASMARGTAAVECYDACCGVAGTTLSKNYIIYDNHRAYPAYIIGFT